MAEEAREINGISIPPAGKYEIDVAHSSLEFVARHILSKTRGRFNEFSGTVVVGENPQESSAEVEIKTASIESNQDQRDEHLKSGDFLQVDEHPVMTFRSTDVRLTGGNVFELDGDLTIKDITKPVTLKGEFNGWTPGMDGTPTFAASAKTTVDREAWDMTWNMVIETGGLLVSKKVDLEIEIEAKQVG
jgi:polyisoprenoid-binding protein YceI